MNAHRRAHFALSAAAVRSGLQHARRVHVAHRIGLFALRWKRGFQWPAGSVRSCHFVNSTS